jgi:hypothetical protein
VSAATIQREIRVVRLPGVTIALGGYAATNIVHGFFPDGQCGSMCMACFGWYDDVRHSFPPRRGRG